MRWICLLVSLLICSTAWADDPAPEEPPVVEEGPAQDEPPVGEEGPVQDEPAPDAPAPLGGEPASKEAEGTPARVVHNPSVQYPETAKRFGIEGTVTVRMFIEASGKLVPRKDPECRWSSLSKQERRESFFDRRWCIEAISGPEALRADTVRDWASSARFEPATDASGTAIRSYLKMETSYHLNVRRR